MEIDYRVNIGVDHELCSEIDVPEFISPEDGEATIASMKRLEEVLRGLHRIEKIRISPNLYFCSDDVRGAELFRLLSNKRVSLPLSAWEGSFEAMFDFRLHDKGSWCQISLPEGFVYSTKLKKPRDIAYIMDGCAEMVVSDEFLAELSKLDPDIYGKAVYSGKRRERSVEGVKQLAVSKFALPSVKAESVGTHVATRNYDFPGSEFMALGLPVLPREQLDEQRGFMRSAEPWSAALVPGWIVSCDIAPDLARLSKDVVLYPVLTEGSDLHKQHDAIWAELKDIVSRFENVAVEGAWHIQDVAPLLRKKK